MYETIKMIGNILADLYNFINAILFYEFNFLGRDIKFYQLLTAFLGGGLVLYVLIKIIQIFI